MEELEKILEEIEQRIEKAKKIIVEHPSDKMDEIANDTAEAFIEAYKECQDIIRKHMNDDWIPVEKEQPEEDGFYIATMDGKIVGQEEPFVGLAEFENGKWIDDEEDYKCVIAWRPMPEVYRPADKTERSET